MNMADSERTENMKPRAFTLIELLVVIAIIALLMAILMPSLRLAKDQAQRVHCVSNTKTLALAWFMYKDENDAKIVGGASWVIKDEVSGKPIPPWVNGQGGTVPSSRTPANPKTYTVARLTDGKKVPQAYSLPSGPFPFPAGRTARDGERTIRSNCTRI
jgi:prepilin-type N-terminal cleavage/methylation domain-containing protein